METFGSGPGIVWNVATDGSKSSDIAYTIVVENLMKETDRVYFNKGL